ncbi:ABC transporter substrate-binding protein, partial [Rhizobiaceae sp. 2RAB30]
MIHASPATLLLWSVSYLAEDLGYYKEEGLDVERVGLGGGPAAMTALLAGEGTVNVSAPGECLAANARGQHIKIIQAYTRSDPYTISVTKAFADANGITSASPREQREKALLAMKGKRLGITAPSSNTDLVARMALKQVGLDPTSDVTIVPTGSIVNIMSALA